MDDQFPQTRLFAFFLADRFSMFSLAAAIDTFRSTNRILGRDYYHWITASAFGESVTASSGLSLRVDYAIADLPPCDILFVCLGTSIDFPGKSKALSVIRNRARHKESLGALSAGSYLLAEAGLLHDRRCTIHWENRASFMEKFPDLICTDNIFEIDNDRYTCAGGTTSIDLMLEIVRGDFGIDLANEVANQFQHERIRSAEDRQRAGPERDLSGKSEKLKTVVRMMADNLDDPLSAADIAKHAGLSIRQVERLFLRYLNTTPGRYYMRLRLERARQLLRQTNLSILDIAIATGFTSHSYFAQSYRHQFGRPPSDERRKVY